MPGTALGHELFNDMPACWNRAPVSWNIFLLFQNTVSTFTGVFTPQLKVWFSGEQRFSGMQMVPICIPYFSSVPGDICSLLRFYPGLHPQQREKNSPNL